MFWDIDQINFSSCPLFYRTRVRSLGMLVTHWLTHSLTDWLTHSYLVNLIGEALACEDDNSKIVGIVTVALFTIRNMLTTFWCRFGRWFGHKVKFLFILWAQGFKVWSIFWSWCSGKILKLKFGHCFAVDASCDYEVQDRFGQEFCKNLWSDLKKLLW